MVTLTPWIHLIITGFVYEVLIFFAFLILLRQYKLSSSEKASHYLPYIAVSHYLPYIAVLAVFTSYVIGLVMHDVLEYVVVTICPTFRYCAERQFQVLTKLPPELIEVYGVSYRDFVMLRHLVVGIFFLGPTFSFWLCKGSLKRFVKPVLIIWTLLMLLLGGAYLIERESLTQSTSAIIARIPKPS